MKNLNSTIVFLILILAGISGYSQITSSQELINDTQSVSSFDYRNKDLVGSNYIDENFLSAKLNIDEIIYSMRYDAYQDEMEIEKDGNTFYLRKGFNYQITFLDKNKIYQVYNYQENEKLNNGFFVVLYNGDKVSLLLQEKIKFYEEKQAKTGYDKYEPPKLKREKDKMFIGYKNNAAKELPKKKKDILKLFSSKSKIMELFAKENKLGFKKPEDLVKIFSYYNSLK
jgi:hypothetical protein